MSDNLFSANTTTQGFRLNFFQLYNWGLFDGEIYTVDARNKSTLLTGENGSGKTTLVDAIMTLLVPQNMRFYNQSSGSNKKHDRSEESYVLGAYGNKQESENAVAKVQTLRDSTAFSVLAGCFVNETTGEIVRLLQVRYFTGDTLQRIFAVTRKRLSIQDINEALVRKNISIDRTPTWRKVLQQEFWRILVLILTKSEQMLLKCLENPNPQLHQEVQAAVHLHHHQVPLRLKPLVLMNMKMNCCLFADIRFPLR